MELSGFGSTILLWPLFMQLFLVISASSKPGGNETDRLALLEFKARVVDPLGVLSSWNESLHFCKWQGISCGLRHQRVTRLVMYSGQLGGHLSPHIGNLSFLRTLDLENNSFSHKIPEEIGRLFRLQILRLHNNSFSGMIPVNLSRCTNLQHLNLDQNKLTGEFPKVTGSLSNLQLLSLNNNNLHGEIPNSISNLSNYLEIFSVEINNFRGSIPNGFALLKRLQYLALGGNNLTGIIPPSIYNLSSILVFSVHTNRLHGKLPSHLGHLLLPNLEALFFHSNQFSGSVPIISNASRLVNFQISINHFTGKVPGFSNLPSLKILEFDENTLGHGEDEDLNFLFSLVNCTTLEVLSINNNNFGGELPECISNFSRKLWLMPFGRNQIKGSIPTGIGNLVNLEALGFDNNQLTGSIPSSIGKLQKLYALSLESNKLSGAIPSSLGNLTSVNLLSLASNNLQGFLPSSIGECKKLAALSLSRNNLSGPIPKEVIGLSSLSLVLDLSQNHFTGSIPIEVGKLVNLGRLDISENKLFGEIPENLGGCEVLEYLSLEGNFLQGTIPKSFNALKGLKFVDFSRNNLSGKVPPYLEDFRFLQNLNLSFNDFEGEIPAQGVFANTSAFSVVGNARVCGGIAQLYLPKCPSNLNTKHKQSTKLIVSAVCGLVAIVLFVLFLGLLFCLRKRTGKSTLGPPFGISFLEVSYGELLKATDGFSSANLIGTGSFGSVYKGIVGNHDNQLSVAVKVLNLQASRAVKSFVAECKVLGGIKHRNIAKLLTACSSIDFQGNDFKALVYEFMINGSLEEWLHPIHGGNLQHRRRLSFLERVNIAIDVANALDYLHNHCHVSIVHSDLKPSNILLDNDMIARVGDFGLARFLSDPSRLYLLEQSSSLGIRGSMGYIAPEYAMGGEPSREGDVYSYGILLLEMFTGKRPTDEMFKDSFNLHNFVKISLPQKLSQVVDSALLLQADQVQERPATREEESYEDSNVGGTEIYHAEENDVNNFQSMPNSKLSMSTNLWSCLHSILKVGISCSEEAAKERMIIGDIIKELEHIRNAYTSYEIHGGGR